MRHRFKVKVTRPTNAETGSASYLPNGKAYELQTWYTDEARRPASATSAVTVKVARSRDASDRCCDCDCFKRYCGVIVMPRTKRPRKTKICKKVVHRTCNNAPQIQGQGLKVTRPTNAETGSASYLRIGEAYELQTWYTDAVRRPASAASDVTFKVKVVRYRDTSDRC